MKTFLRKYIPYSLAVLLMIGSIGYLQTRTALAAPAFVATTAAKNHYARPFAKTPSQPPRQ